jgi:hypothetical protein
MRWLIAFLRAWYDLEEIASEIQHLGIRLRTHIETGDFENASETLEHMYLLAEVAVDNSIYPALAVYILQWHREFRSKLDERLAELEKQGETHSLIELGLRAAMNEFPGEALQSFDQAVRIDPNSHLAWHLRESTLTQLLGSFAVWFQSL